MHVQFVYINVREWDELWFFPVLTLFINQHYTVLTNGKTGRVYFIYSILLAIIVLYNHRSNIQRILNGTENKLSFKK